MGGWIGCPDGLFNSVTDCCQLQIPFYCRLSFMNNGTLIFSTDGSVTAVVVVARTRKRASIVGTCCMDGAVVVSKSALVDVVADEACASVSGLTFTRVASVTVGADSVGTAVVDSVAFIVVDAAGTVIVITSLTAATISSVTGH